MPVETATAVLPFQRIIRFRSQAEKPAGVLPEKTVSPEDVHMEKLFQDFLKYGLDVLLPKLAADEKTVLETYEKEKQQHEESLDQAKQAFGALSWKSWQLPFKLYRGVAKWLVETSWDDLAENRAVHVFDSLNYDVSAPLFVGAMLALQREEYLNFRKDHGFSLSEEPFQEFIRYVWLTDKGRKYVAGKTKS